MEFVKFIFSNVWYFLGFIVILILVIAGLIEIFKNSRKEKVTGLRPIELFTLCLLKSNIVFSLEEDNIKLIFRLPYNKFVYFDKINYSFLGIEEEK